VLSLLLLFFGVVGCGAVNVVVDVHVFVVVVVAVVCLFVCVFVCLLVLRACFVLCDVWSLLSVVSCFLMFFDV